ncbi:hypothetical protein J6590_063641 [Homalodisca vitripennis]|nr:hypothetical protein J6590_063641 [Homalodisca vitripennis]
MDIIKELNLVYIINTPSSKRETQNGVNGININLIANLRADEHKRLDLFLHKESDKDFSAIITNPRDCRLPSAQPETSELTVCFPECRQTVVTAWDLMLEAIKEAIDNNYEGNESSVTFSYPPASEIKTAVYTSNRTEFLSCHEMDELTKESGPTPNTSYRDVKIQKEASAEDDFEMLNECDVTLSRASSPCLSIMEDSEWVDKELGKDFRETSPKTNVNSSTNYITTIQGAPQRMQPPQPEKTEAPEEINKHVLDCPLKTFRRDSMLVFAGSPNVWLLLELARGRHNSAAARLRLQFGPSGPVYQTSEQDSRPRACDGWTTNSLALQCLEPMRRWRIVFTGRLHSRSSSGQKDTKLVKINLICFLFLKASFIHYRLARPDIASPEPQTMEGRRIQWMGHVKRMGDNRMPRIALEKEEGGRRPRGRPRGRWEDQVWKDIERRGLQKIQVDEEETWKDRLKWRRLCTTTTRENGNV